MPDFIYDEVQYQDEPIKATNISLLHAVGTLFGLTPTNPNKARVLELGCARAMNIISLSYLHPESEFVGVDLSKAQIEVAQKRISDLGLTNIQAKHASILDIDESWGKFDYIIAHGVLSWVPEEVRKKIFSIFDKNLSETGIGYLSYNTYPGWHIRDPLRYYMLEASKDATSPNAKAEASREILSFLLRCMEAEDTPISKSYQHEIRQMISMPNWYYIHDFIADYCQPFYFVDIVRSFRENNLDYLGDSEIAAMLPGNLSTKVQQALRQKAIDEIKVEHLMDFCSNRMFRRTLVVKAGSKISRKVFPKQIFNSHLSSPLHASPETADGPKVRFIHPNGGGLESADPLLHKIVEQISGKWPEAVSLLDLFAYVNLYPETPKALEIAEQLLRCAFANLIDITYYPNRCASKISETPRASKLTRYVAQSSSSVPTLRHDAAHLDPIEQKVLCLLDGEKTLEQLLETIKATLPQIVTTSSLNDISSLKNFLLQFAKKSLLEG